VEFSHRFSLPPLWRDQYAGGIDTKKRAVPCMPLGDMPKAIYGDRNKNLEFRMENLEWKKRKK
jgi:hypothetical protein